MKLALISDFHLGYDRFEADALAQAEEAVKKACGLADALVIAGDIFDSKTPRQEVLASAINLFQIPFSKKIPVAAIHGTHERRTKDLVNPVQLLEFAGLLQNAHAKPVELSKNGEKICIQGLGGVPEEYAKAGILAREFKPVPGSFNIFVFHQSIRELMPFSEDFLSEEDLPKGFDLYVNGHLHKKSIVSLGKSKLLIPGSTVVTQLKKEETEGKGFFLFDTKTGKEEFISIPVRPFFFKELKFEGAGAEDVVSEIKRAAEELSAKAPNPLIRIVVSGSLAKGLEPSSLDFRSIEKSFEPRAFLEISSELASTALSDKINLLRELRQKKASVREMGLEILKARLKESKFPASQIEDFFNALAADSEEALKKFFCE